MAGRACSVTKETCPGARKSRTGVRIPIVATKRLIPVEPRGVGKWNREEHTVSFATVCSSRFHFPTPLGSTGISRFVATMGILTPVLLFLAPGQVSLVTEHALPAIQSPTTPYVPSGALLLAPGRLCPRLAFWAVG